MAARLEQSDACVADVTDVYATPVYHMPVGQITNVIYKKSMALCQLPKEIIVSARRNFEWPELLTADGRGIAFGGDYNPDQWSEDIWDDDIRLMKQAGVNTVALAIFSWDRIQPTEDRSGISAGSTASSTNSAMPASWSTWPPRRRPRRCGCTKATRRSFRVTSTAIRSTPARANPGARPARCSRNTR